MKTLNRLEQAVLNKLLSGEQPILTGLRVQAKKARLVSREFTGVGFFCSFEVPADVPNLATRENFGISDVNASIEGLEHGAGFILFVREGRMITLEGFSYDEPWPENVTNFKLTYQKEPRSLKLPELC